LECGRNAPSESRATNQADCASTGGLPGVGGGGTVKCRRGSSRGDAVEGYWRFPADYITARNAHFLCPTDASPTKTRSGSCGLSKRLHPKAQCFSRLLSWGSFQRCPSTDVTGAPTSRLNRSSTVDSSMPTLKFGPSMSFLTTPTALCAPACGFVAPRSQLWGSPGFRRPQKRLSSSLAPTLRSFSLVDS